MTFRLRPLTQAFLTASCTLLSCIPAFAEMPSVTIGKENVVKLEVASTQQEIEHGLMYRTALPEDSGMVFVFHPEQHVHFWMYHTLISLDMCFVHNGKIVKVFQDVPPCKSENSDDCPLYPSTREGMLVSEVIELKAGYARRHGIKEGDAVVFHIPGDVAK
jgi:uncharacterized protein